MPYKKKPELKVEMPKTGPGKRLLSLGRSLAVGFDWTRVDAVEMRAAYWTAGLAGAAIMISPAAGGRGVCLKLFLDEDRITEYATLPEELNMLFTQIIEQLNEGNEDPRAVFKLTPVKPLDDSDLTAAARVHFEADDPYKDTRRPIGS